ncbi:MAG: NTP transferase domain-containing protein [Bacteroidaceae bacterium]|nr:NTP transferase domain-containing protein [Bacteroidaceae bacterium]
MKAMIFAAGLGTRLKPLTDHMPKALVPLNGKPLLGILLDKLGNYGFDDVVINIHHFADMIEEWAKEERPDNLRIRFSDERQQLLETGGGIRHARPLLEDAERFLIHNVDILSNCNLPQFMAAGREAEATLLVSQRETQRYLLFDDQHRLVGWTNTATGEVRSPNPELNPNQCHRRAFAGIHQMSTSLFPLMDKWPEKFSIIDFYLSICASHCIMAYEQPNLRLMDVGKIATLSQAEQFAQELA